MFSNDFEIDKYFEISEITYFKRSANSFETVEFVAAGVTITFRAFLNLLECCLLSLILFIVNVTKITAKLQQLTSCLSRKHKFDSSV